MKTEFLISTGLSVLLAMAGCVTAQPAGFPQSPKAESPNQDVSASQIQQRIAQLNDSDFTKRNAAVRALAAESAAALPLLEQKLKTETDSNRRWWLKVAIQECEENRPMPADIYAAPDRSEGLQVCDCKGEGSFTLVEHEGVRCWQTPKRVGNTWSYLYFQAEETFRQQVRGPLEIELEYLDSGIGEIVMEYDSTDIRLPMNGAYKKHPRIVQRGNSGEWRKARFSIPDARFRGSENNATDFRFYNGGDDLLVRAVRVRRLAPAS